MKRKILIAVTILVLFLAVTYAVYVHCRDDYYRKLLQVELEVGDAVLIDGEWGFLEGCGVAVFELSPQTRSQLRTKGTTALRGVWLETPYVETGDGMTLEDRWLVGLTCAKMSHKLSITINQALTQPGSFISKRPEAAIIVIPTAGIVALVYFG